MLLEIRQFVYPCLTAAAIAGVERHFAQGLDYVPVRGDTLVHFDFGPGNMLYVGGLPAGVIDFSSAGLGEPAMDAASLLSFPGGMAWYGPLCDEYPKLSGTTDRIKYYQGTFALQEALHGVRTGDRRAVQAGCAAAEKRFRPAKPRKETDRN